MKFYIIWVSTGKEKPDQKDNTGGQVMIKLFKFVATAFYNQIHHHYYFG